MNLFKIVLLLRAIAIDCHSYEKQIFKSFSYAKFLSDSKRTKRSRNEVMSTHTVWKVSKYRVISGPYFPVFGLNTERYSVFLHIQSECRKIRTRNNSVFGQPATAIHNQFSFTMSTIKQVFVIPLLTEETLFTTTFRRWVSFQNISR